MKLGAVAMEVPPQLQKIADNLQSDSNNTAFVSPREILSWFQLYRRTWRQVQLIRRVLSKLQLETFPDFEGVGIDEAVILYKADASPFGALPPVELEVSSTTSTSTTTPAATPSELSQYHQPMAPAMAETKDASAVDPVHRVARFLSSNPLVSVTRDSSLQAAITKMLINDYSQLPVMQNDRKVDGVISWSSIGKRRSLCETCESVADCMITHVEVKSSDSIFTAIRMIKEHDFVLVRSADYRILGILTAADISVTFEQIARPFLLLSYIENHLRSLIRRRFTVEDLECAKDPSDADRRIVDVSDMTFGEYIRLLEAPENWNRLKMELDRRLVLEQLHEVRKIRNDVMHFNPEGIEDRDMDALRKVNAFLEMVVSDDR